MVIKTKRQKHIDGVMLQLNGNTLHSITLVRRGGQRWYESDRFSTTYDSVADAKQKTLALARAGVFGEPYTTWAFAL